MASFTEAKYKRACIDVAPFSKLLLSSQSLFVPAVPIRLPVREAGGFQEMGGASPILAGYRAAEATHVSKPHACVTLA